MEPVHTEIIENVVQKHSFYSEIYKTHLFYKIWTYISCPSYHHNRCPSNGSFLISQRALHNWIWQSSEVLWAGHGETDSSCEKARNEFSKNHFSRRTSSQYNDSLSSSNISKQTWVCPSRQEVFCLSRVQKQTVDSCLYVWRLNPIHENQI